MKPENPGKTRYTNYFAKYHSVVNIFAEQLRKEIHKRFDVSASEFSTLCCAYAMEFKNKYFFSDFVMDMRKVDRSVAHRSIRMLIDKGCIEKGVKLRHKQSYKLTTQGRAVISSYSMLYIKFVKEFEDKYWKLNGYK
jgi:DNA-binding MarR family transcriptional regulator